MPLWDAQSKSPDGVIGFSTSHNFFPTLHGSDESEMDFYRGCEKIVFAIGVFARVFAV
jgi:hypothetical protein